MAPLTPFVLVGSLPRNWQKWKFFFTVGARYGKTQSYRGYMVSPSGQWHRKVFVLHGRPPVLIVYEAEHTKGRIDGDKAEISSSWDSFLLEEAIAGATKSAPGD